MRLDGQTALVTGGAAGIGRAVVEAFLAEGARVGVVDRSAEGLAALGDRHGERLVTVAGDVTRLQDNAKAVAAVVDAFGGLDVLVANAGIGDRGIALAELPADRVDAAFDEVFGVNVKGCLLGAHAAVPVLRRRRGTIIFTASFSSFHPAGGGPLYVASKHAVVGLMRQLAYELAPDVRVNAVAPGLATTALGGVSSLGHEPASALIPGVERHLPLGFVPDEADHAPAYVFLAARAESRAMTGSVIATDSGLGIRGIVKVRGDA